MADLHEYMIERNKVTKSFAWLPYLRIKKLPSGNNPVTKKEGGVIL